MENNSSMVTLRSNINSYGNIEDFPPERFQRRVKVYYQSDRDWVVAGTGICTIEPVWENLPTIGDFMIRVLNEEKEGDIILSSRIRDLDCYQNQQETLLVWKDECPEIGSIEVCISFLDQIGRDEIWGCINFINKPPISPTLTESQPSSPHVDDTDYSAIADLIPQPDLNNLDTLETNLLSLIRGQNRKNSISSYFFQTQFIEQLVDVFKLCHDMEDDERMFRLCKITKYIFMLNEQSILEKCLSDSLYLDIAGILEHDLESPNKELNYKEFLSKRERYRQVVPIGNQATLANIHFYYRLKYFKEVILNRTLDEAGFALMTFLLQNKNVEIINYVSRDSAYLTSLFNITKSEDVSKKRDLVAYLQNFCNQVKEIPPQMKTGIFKNSVNHGLFDIFQFSLNDTMDSVRKDSLEILLFIMDNDLELVRSNIMAKIKIGSVSLFQIIVKRFLVEEVTGIRLYLIEVIRALIDLNGFSGDRNMAFVNQMPPRTDPNFNELLDVFYEQFASDVFSPLIRLQASDFVKDSQNSKSLTSSQGTTLHYLCDLLTFNIKTHTLKSRQFIMDNNLLTKLIILFKSPKLPLQLAALRALKATLATKNPNYLNYFIRKDLIKSVFELYKSTNGANNMLNSACLDLFEFIRQQNFKQLISSIVTNYTPILENLEPKEVFSKLITVHQTNSEEAQSENKDSQDSTNERTQNPSTLQGRGWNSSTLNQNEEKYFEDSESDEEDAMDIDEEDSSNTSNQPPQLNGHQSINSQSSSQAEEPDVLENENNLNRLNRNITQIRSNGGSRIIPGQRQNRTLLKRTNNRIESSADLPTSDSKRRFVINLSPNTVNKISDNESASNGTNEKEEQSVKSPPQDPESMDLDQTQSISPNEPVSKTDSNSNNDAKLDTDSQSSDSLADDDLDNSRTEKEEDSPEQNQQSKSRSPSPIENQNSKNDSDSDTNTETISAPLSPPIVKNS